MFQNGLSAKRDLVSTQDQPRSASHRSFQNFVVARIGASLDNLARLDVNGSILEQPKRGPALSSVHIAIECRLIRTCSSLA